MLQPFRVSVLGGPPSHCHGCGLPWSSLTSRYTQMCGLAHSTLVTTPLRVTGLLMSNSAAKEWCADRGRASVSAMAAASTKCFVCICAGGLPMGDPYAHRCTPVPLPAQEVCELRNSRAAEP